MSTWKVSGSRINILVAEIVNLFSAILSVFILTVIILTALLTALLIAFSQRREL